jgi:hypothetical protein
MMFILTFAILMVPVDSRNPDDVFSRSVPCCSMTAIEAGRTGGADRPNQRKSEPTVMEISALAREAQLNSRLAKTSTKGNASITVIPVKFAENSKLDSLERGMVVGEIHCKGIQGLPDGKSALFISSFDGKHHSYVVHEGKIVNKSLTAVRNADNKAASVSVSLTSETGGVSPITICGRKWCVEIKIKRKGT